MIGTNRSRRQHGWALAVPLGVLVLTACSGFDRDPVADLAAVTVVADDPTVATTAAPAAAAEPDAALRVTVTGETMGSDADPSSTSSSTSSTTSSSSSTTSTTAATTSTLATTASTSSPTSSTTAITPSSSNTPSSSSSTPSSSASSTQAPPPAVVFPVANVTRHSGGQVVSFADQVAGSRPVLVWFWLPN